MSYWGLPNGGYGIKQIDLRSKLLSSINKDALFSAIDADPAIRGAAVIFIGENNVAICLRQFKPIVRQKPITVVLQMTNNDTLKKKQDDSVFDDPHVSKVLSEAGSTAISCGGFILSYFGVASLLATPLVANPVGIIIIAISAAATFAGGVQCFGSAGRLYLSAAKPKMLKEIDQNKWYQAISQGLDIVSLAGIGAASYQTLRYVKLMILDSSIPIRSLLAGLSNTQKRKLQDELLSYMHKNSSAETLAFLKSQKIYLYSSKEVREATFYNIKQALASYLSLSTSSTVHKGIKKITESNKIAISILH
ncbi:hypothetical protein MSP8887_03392 [Marinomonas spartinae]|uniref:hypothetical protein n=1 Tax=Marinomonas spartinae TaxID=1792290 RepID=UPI000808F7A5|nr:hypothetical protein [Marinomonas spartinae]SBS38614.1 hypothetical protein MSP8887_03392 [Marinomonas spartinae]